MSIPREELNEWREWINQVIFHTEYERNFSPLSSKASIIHGLNNAVRMNNPEANCLMGMCHLQLKLSPNLGDFFEPHDEKGISLLRRAAEADFAPAIYQLAECFRLGIGTGVNKNEAVRLYTSAAEEPRSFKAAQRQLGVLHFEGMLVPQDYNEAVRWFQLATQQDDLEAIVRLGLCYEMGLGGLEKNHKHSLDLFEVASNKHHPFANACIGRAYDDGIGHRWDPERALKYYERAAEAGNAVGQIGAAWLLLTGGGGHVTQDAAKSTKYLTAAADGGSEEAQYLLGLLYLDPTLGGKVDNRKGLEQMTKAADSGILLAHYAIAQMYHFGQYGIPVDLKKALASYDKAAAQGHDISKARLIVLKKLMAEEEGEEEEKKGGKKGKGKR
mmetsp:Transcript_29864/g.84174  ORF Transcript_29864/g.84174 Transcript_29864/m.84174 type:complete len:386 (-) Transcript_29864:2525-3682(-)